MTIKVLLFGFSIFNFAIFLVSLINKVPQVLRVPSAQVLFEWSSALGAIFRCPWNGLGLPNFP